MRDVSRALFLSASLCAIGCSSGDQQRDDTAAHRARAVDAVPASATEATSWVVEDQLVANPLSLVNPLSNAAPTVAMDGSTLALGFPEENWWDGAVYTFTSKGSLWVLQDKLTSHDGYDRTVCLSLQPLGSLCNRFGQTLAVSDNRLLVGAPGNGTRMNNFAGAGFVYSRLGNSWAEFPRKLVDPEPAYKFGNAADIDGNMLVLGSGIDGWSGHVTTYVLRGEFWELEDHLHVGSPRTTNPGEWETQYFGGPLALSSDTLALGSGDGVTHLFRWEGSSWKPLQRLPVRGAPGLRGLAGDTLVVGRSAQGSRPEAHVFVNRGSRWEVEHVLTGTIPSVVTEDVLLAPSGTPSAFVRTASGWLQQPLPGPGSDAGAVNQRTALVGSSVYEQNGSVWNRTQQLKVSSSWPPPPIVAAGAAGDRAVIASIRPSEAVEADIFVRDAKSWRLEQRVGLPAAAEKASVALSEERLLLSPLPSAAGAARTFVKTQGGWTLEHEFLTADGSGIAGAVSLSGDTCAIGVPEIGTVYVFVRGGSGWIQQTVLHAPEGVATSRFGSAVSLSGNVLLVGAPEEATTSGSAYMFVRDGTSWVQQQRLRPTRPETSGGFGFSVALSEDFALIGAPRADASAVGAVYSFVRDGTTWNEESSSLRGDSVAAHLFGTSISVTRGGAVIGTGGDRPAAYVFVRNEDGWRLDQKLADLGVSGERFGTAVGAAVGTLLVGTTRGAYVLSPRSPQTIGAACRSATDCMSRVCADGVCCDQACEGACQSCAGYETGAADGTCLTVLQGTRCGPNPLGCASADEYATMPTCDAAGICQPNSTRCADGFACRGGSARGHCVTDCAPAGVFDHTICAKSHWCASDPTGTGNGICLPDKRGRERCASAEECASGECAGSWCMGAQGDTCQTEQDCAAALTCRDGYCCNSACAGVCEACNVEKHLGTCTPKQGRPEPGHGYCKGAGTDCEGTCDGSTGQICAYPVGDACGSGTTCHIGSATQYGFMCNEAGRCEQNNAGRSCFPYAACGDANRCLTECGSSRDCVSTHYCDPKRRQCVAKLANGRECDGAAECSSGHCVDGVCCDQECDGSCEVCSLGEQDAQAGRCRAVEGVPRGGRQACVGTGACVGYCNGSSRECFYPGAARECAPAACVNGLLTPGRQCDGAGDCAAQPAQACPGFFACDAQDAACKTRCVSDADCSSGARCALDSRTCVLPGGSCFDDFTVRLPDNLMRSCHGYRCIGDGQCAESCSAELSCALGYDCVSGRCKDRPVGDVPDAGGQVDGGDDGDRGNPDPNCSCHAVGVSARTSDRTRGFAVAGLMFGIGSALRARAQRKRRERRIDST